MPIVTQRTALAAIDALGACLVFPDGNKPEPVSLWSYFHPRSKMRWEWDSDYDPRVVTLWHLRSQLAESQRVAYTKWYRGKAMFLSLPLFSALAHVLARDEELGLSDAAVRLYQCFEEQSPLSTKEAKRAAELTGRENERAYEAAMRELWQRLLVVGAGEKAEGSFPSLLVGASKWMLGEAWLRSRELTDEEANRTIVQFLPPGSPFHKHLEKLRAQRTR